MVFVGRREILPRAARLRVLLPCGISGVAAFEGPDGRNLPNYVQDTVQHGLKETHSE